MDTTALGTAPLHTSRLVVRNYEVCSALTEHLPAHKLPSNGQPMPYSHSIRVCMCDTGYRFRSVAATCGSADNPSTQYRSSPIHSNLVSRSTSTWTREQCNAHRHLPARQRAIPDTTVGLPSKRWVAHQSSQYRRSIASVVVTEGSVVLRY